MTNEILHSEKSATRVSCADFTVMKYQVFFIWPFLKKFYQMYGGMTFDNNFL
jgi:hypothetical protein